jgi:hypothetical protein
MGDLDHPILAYAENTDLYRILGMVNVEQFQ